MKKTALRVIRFLVRLSGLRNSRCLSPRRLLTPLYYQGQKKISRFRLCEITKNQVPEAADEIRLFVMTRNEALRLPFFLEYYFKLGVDRIFLIDNYSDDETLKIARNYENVHIFITNQGREKLQYARDHLLDRFGVNHWCLLVDADEIFTYALADSCSLRQLCAYLDARGYCALMARLLDMYSSCPINAIEYLPGQNPFDTCRFFDADFEVKSSYPRHRRTGIPYRSRLYIGNTRKRIFGVNACMSKVPLIKYSSHMDISEGHHCVAGAVMADIRGVVLHSRFLQDFSLRASQDLHRSLNLPHRDEYQAYDKIIKSRPDISLWHDLAFQYKDCSQLEELGVLSGSRPLKRWLSNRAPEVSIIAVTSAQENIFQLQILINSVLTQSDLRWKLYVVHDGPAPEARALVESYQDPRILYRESAQQMGNFGNFNRQQILSEVDTEWVTWTNADNYYTPRFVEFMLEAGESQQLGLVLCDCVYSGNRSWKNGVQRDGRGEYCVLYSKKVELNRLYPKGPGLDYVNFICRTELAQQVSRAPYQGWDMPHADNLLITELFAHWPELRWGETGRVLAVHN